MTPEQQRIKIAEACGWWGNCKENCMQPPNCTDMYCEIPNYCNDLNAMHETEKFLTNDQWLDYDLELMVITNCDDIVQKKRISATAKQRAEAFLRTLNLWTE